MPVTLFLRSRISRACSTTTSFSARASHRNSLTSPDEASRVRKAGFEVVRSRYFFWLLFPLAAAIRLYKARKLKNSS